MTTLRVTLIDNQPAVVLPADLAEKLNVSEGGELRAIPSLNGVELVSDQDLANQLEAARRVMDEDRQALRKLAE